MYFNPSTAISVIEGIGSVTADLLAKIGVVTLHDLLQRREKDVHAAVRSHASKKQVHSWRQMTVLLQIAEMTPQWAEALVRGGINTIDELLASSYDELQELFQKSKDERIIPSIPSNNSLAAMLTDAAVMRNTGNLTGRVEHLTGQPVTSAEVNVGRVATETDTNGRFRLLRIPLIGRPPLIINHPEYKTLVVDSLPICINAEVINVLSFKLQPLSEESEEPVEQVKRLSELDGDVLPQIQGHRVRSVRLEADQLRDHDLLMVRYFYKRTEDVGLVSRLKAYEDGEIIVHTFRLRKSHFSAEVELGDHFVVKNGELVNAEMDNLGLLRHKIKLQCRKRFEPIPAELDSDELRDRLKERLDFSLNQYRLFRPRRRSL